MQQIRNTKYSVVTGGPNRGLLKNVETGQVIPADEPVFIVRAQDKTSTALLDFAATKVLKKNPEHAKAIRGVRRAFLDWRRQNPDQVKDPT